MAVLTLPEVMDHLNIPDTGSEAEILAFAARAEAAVAAKCGPLEPTTVSTRVRGWGRSLSPRLTPILSITSVTPVGGSAIDVDTLIAPDCGLRGPKSIEKLDGSYFSERWYDVVYQAGRSPVPEDLRLALLEAVRSYWDTQRGNALPQSALPSGDGDVPLGPTSFPWSRVEHLVEPYEQLWL